ncbi:hypothetical protein PG996_001441 [Apiospora saccharicola]|uniref:Ecp2 effector protein domain-containing protein n=1 Tax=Apiospora saccharicola TaxID=335842 RepID=A0ABR1WGM9_9PEZI
MKLTTVYAAAAPNPLPVTETPSLVTERLSTGSGPQGLVTENNFHRYLPAKMIKINSTFSTPESTSSDFVGECLTPTTAKYEDCVSAIGDLSGYPGNIVVQSGTCYNWWEGSCLVKICAEKNPYTGNVTQIVNTITSTLLNPCIRKGLGGVDSDCASFDSQCGTFRYWLIAYGGEYDWAV